MTSLSVRRSLAACALAAATAVSAVGLAAPGVASAATQCSGVNITGQGANVALNAHEFVWDPDFNTSTNTSACAGGKKQGNGAKPTVGFVKSSASVGLESWGANGKAGPVYGTTNAYISASEPPNPTQIAEIESHETTPTANTVLSIPTFQTALAVIVNLPTGCTATSKKDKGRLELTNVELEGIFRGTIKTWGGINTDGDTLTGSGCATDPIGVVVRSDLAGTSHIFKRYLAQINNASFTDEKENSVTWNDVSEGSVNGDWPKAAAVTRPTKTGDTAIDEWVASHPGTISYTTLAEARKNGSFTASPGTGGPNTAKFWAPIQNNGLATTGKLKFADPSSNKDVATLGDSNCKNTEYTNGEVAFPPASAEDAWDQVTTATTEPKYTLCSIVVELAFKHYGAYPGTSSEEAQTVHDFFGFVTNAKGSGGQKLIEDHDYLALPKGNVLKEAEAGAAAIGF
jgi:ABC-type phosphate transport system substrate-binding protein